MILSIQIILTALALVIGIQILSFTKLNHIIKGIIIAISFLFTTFIILTLMAEKKEKEILYQYIEIVNNYDAVDGSEMVNSVNRELLKARKDVILKSKPISKLPLL